MFFSGEGVKNEVSKVARHVATCHAQVGPHNHNDFIG